MKDWKWPVWILGLGAVLSAAPFVIFRDRLPDPMASHWSGAGVPDGSTPFGWLIVVNVGLVVGLGGLLGGVMTQRETGSATPTAEGLGLAGFMAGLGVGVAWSTVVANLDAPTWQEADPLGWMLPAALVGAVLAGLGAYRLGRRRFPRLQRSSDEPLPYVAVPAGSSAAWVGTARSPWMLLLVIPGVLLTVFVPGPARWTGVPVALMGVLFGWVTVRVGSGGVTVLLAGVLPVRRVRLGRIERATAEHIDPSRWGGWGYRLSPRGAAVVIRAGDGLVLDLTGGGAFAVTVDDARQGAGLVNGLLG